MESVAAVIVTFFPDEDLKSRLLILLSEFDRVFLVDNGSGPSLDSLLSQLPDQDSLVVCRFDENRGLGAALNAGVSLAADYGIDWVCCFDQDTSFFSGSLGLYHEAIASDVKRVVGAGYKENFWGRQHVIGCGNRAINNYHFVTTVISSGSMFSIALWRSIGEFDEELFIDSIDHDFCLKVHDHGGDVVRLNAETLKHSIGEGETLLGVPLHKPVRKYYIFRNVFLMIKRHFYRHPLWCMKQMARLVLESFSILLVENDKRDKAKNAFFGAWHGIRGVSGKYGD